MRRVISILFLIAICLLTSTLDATEPVDLDAVTRIRDQGFRHSQVMDLAWHLTEAIGPRLTGTPAELAAHEWAKDTFESWGLESWLEAYDFGRSWGMERAQVRMLAPYMQPLEALPEAWSPGTDGPQGGTVIRATLESLDDLEEWKGKLGLLTVVFRFETKEDGNFTGFLDSPIQGSYGIPITGASFTDGKLKLKVKTINGEFIGQLSGNSLTGDWTQNGRTSPLTLKKKN